MMRENDVTCPIACGMFARCASSSASRVNHPAEHHAQASPPPPDASHNTTGCPHGRHTLMTDGSTNAALMSSASKVDEVTALGIDAYSRSKSLGSGSSTLQLASVRVGLACQVVATATS